MCSARVQHNGMCVHGRYWYTIVFWLTRINKCVYSSVPVQYNGIVYMAGTGVNYSIVVDPCRDQSVVGCGALPGASAGASSEGTAHGVGVQVHI